MTLKPFGDKIYSMKNFPLTLPSGFKILDEKYSLANDQGLKFLCNLLSQSNVISVFKADEGVGMNAFDMMIRDYSQITPSLALKKKFNVRLGEKTYPIYIIGGENGSLMAQGFLEKDGVYCFVASLAKAGKNYSEYKKLNPAIDLIVSIMRCNR